MGFVRKHLSADGLLKIVRHGLSREDFPECKNTPYSWEDCIMSGLAVFGLKQSSLLQFEKAKASEPLVRSNLKTLYGVTKAPSDTCMRERLDRVLPSQLRFAYKKIFAYLQRGKALESYRYLDGHYIISIDGTGQYCSKTVHCENCCEKSHRDGSKTYYHHMLGAVLVHPDMSVVIPLAPEPIVKGDGFTKNDCEQNASKRLLTDLRREHPHLKVLIVEDGLSSNYPHLSLLDSLKMSYVIGVKPGDHEYLFDRINDLKATVHIQKDPNGTVHEFRYYSDVPLNKSHHDYRVQVLEYCETQPSGKTQKFSWVTNLSITSENVYKIMRSGRSQWKIENETFNTLKNQGYNFEHNYGHGYQNLCSVMTMLMNLAFLIDQVQQLCCTIYQKARQHSGKLSALFEKARILFEFGLWDSWQDLYRFIGDPASRTPPGEHGWIL
ncbi:MAG: transposase [Sphingobacteriia bacterium]|nr:transposase [Sphingobacteriia bacterium]